MRTEHLIQPSAEVITITSLKKGDVYKRLEKDYGNTYSLRLGIVEDVMHNGNDCAFTAIEYEPNYNSVSTRSKVFGTESEVRLFAATPSEIAVHFDDVVRTAERGVEARERELADAQTTLQSVQDALHRIQQGTLTAPETNQGY
jgi:hypothetical protein